jgi:hypothetical protein
MVASQRRGGNDDDDFIRMKLLLQGLSHFYADTCRNQHEKERIPLQCKRCSFRLLWKFSLVWPYHGRVEIDITAVINLFFPFCTFCATV